jgi:phosphodiesterase/alkaline phosphatase D-like protein
MRGVFVMSWRSGSSFLGKRVGQSRGARVAVTAALVAALLTVATGVVSASAQPGELTIFGSAGSGAGHFSSPQGVAFDQSSGDVYVADAGNFRVEKFSETGTFILAFGQGVDVTTGGNVCSAASGDTCGVATQGSAAGEFSTPTFVAVDNSSGPSAGDVYVGDPVADVVSKFDSSGNLITSWGSSGQLNGSSTFQSIDGIAVDSSGNLFVINTNNQLYEFAQDGTAVTNFATTRGMSANGLAVGSSGNFFKVNGDGSVEEMTSTGSVVGTPAGDGGNVSTATEIAIDPASGNLYVDTGTSIAEDVFDPSGNVLESGASPCTVTESVGCNATELFGTLASGTGLAFDPSVTLPGSAGAGALYVADQTNNDVTVFVPPAPAAPSVLANSETATSVTSDSATLNANVNAQGGDTTYYFEYVDNADYNAAAPDPYSAGTQVPLPPGTDIGSNFVFYPASVNLTGLSATTSYHFRVVAINSLGTTDGADATFTTATPSAPSVDGESSTSVTADTATLNAQINPGFADTTYYFEYVDAANYNAAAPDPYSAGTQIPLPPGTDIGSAGSDQPASVNLTGLQPGTNYHFRVVAINSLGTTDGADSTFGTPLIVTGVATNVTELGATVSGTINPEGTATDYHFEYGTDTTYGNQAPVPDGTVGSDSTSHTLSQALTGLAPGTLYHYRLDSVVGGFVAYGADETFTTVPLPTLVTTSAASAIGEFGATVSGTINPEGLATDYHFEYGTDTTYGSQAPVPDATVGSDSSTHILSQALSGLAPGTTYHYRLDAVVGGFTVDGTDQTFTTLPLPTLVTTGAASGVNATGATVSGTINPEGLATDYHFEYGTDTTYGSVTPATPATVGSNSTIHAVKQTLNALAPSTTYHYQLVADVSGNLVYGADQTFTTPALPSVLPTVVTTGQATQLNATGATVLGTINPGGLDTQYHFEYGTDTTYGNVAPVPDGQAGSGTRAGALRQVLTGLSPNTLYHYRLDAVIDGNVVNGADKTFTTNIGLGIVELQGAFGVLDVNTTYPAITSFSLRNPDGSMPTQAMVGGSGSAQTSISDASTGQTYQSSQVSPTKVVVTKNGQGVVTGVFLGGIAVVPGQETEDWTITTANNGETVRWVVNQHWSTNFAGSNDSMNLPFSPKITGDVWVLPNDIYAPSWDSNPDGEGGSSDYSDTLTQRNAWLIEKLYSPYDFGSDLKLAVSGGYLNESGSLQLGAVTAVQGSFTERSHSNSQISLSLSGVNKYSTGQQLSVSIPDTAMQSSLKDMYDSVLNGGALSGQKAYLFGNETRGVMSGYGALFDASAFANGIQATGATSSSPYSMKQAIRGYLQAELESVDLTNGQINYGISGGGYGAGGYQDVGINTLQGLYAYTCATGDLSLIEQYQHQVDALLNKWIGRIQPNGLILSYQSDGGYDDTDFFGNSSYDLYLNDFAYEALLDMSQLEIGVAAQTKDAATANNLRLEANAWTADAATIKNGINTVLWTPNSPNGPMYADWINLDNNQRYYIFKSDDQYPAIQFGIASKAQATAILATADARLAVLSTEGYVGDATLTSLWPEDSTTNIFKYCGFWCYFDGGSFMGETYFEVMARADAGDAVGAYQRLQNFAADYAATAFYGDNWAPWNGIPGTGPFVEGEPYLEDMVYTASSLIQGILGINQSWNGLEVTPHLPPGWINASATVMYKGRQVCVTITQRTNVSESRGHC